MVITFNNVSFEYSNKKILDKASFSISDNEKIGVVGVNGTGKTTIIKLILGKEVPNSGEIIKSGGIIINCLNQEVDFDTEKSILDVVLEASSKEHVVDEYEAKTMLSKMGFDDYTINSKTLSGGEKKKVALAKVLVAYSDLLILDEPTNHLDASLIVWLEKYLIKYKGSILLVTHDRYFLERICKKMLELDYGKTYMYDANYSLYLELKAERLALEEASKRKLSNILKREREWINRGAEARSTKQKARKERYYELLQVKFNDRNQKMKFDSNETRLGKKLIEIKSGYKAFNNKVLFEDFSFVLKRNDCIGVVGNNGSGKSTLFKIIMGLESLDKGELIKGKTLNLGYFPQTLSLIDDNVRIIDYIEEERKAINTPNGVLTSAQFLESFLFDRNTHYMEVKTLSGGEKRRLQLIRVLSNNPNVLLLDEPTNDLDIYTLEILEDYLLEFNGPILVVSHDRYFLDKICNKLFIFDNGKIIESNEMYSDYLEKSLKTKQPKEERINKYLEKDKEKRELNSAKKEHKKLLEEIEILENNLNSISQDMEKETTDYLRIMDLQDKKTKIEKSIEEKLDRILILEELIN